MATVDTESPEYKAAHSLAQMILAAYAPPTADVPALGYTTEAAPGGGLQTENTPTTTTTQPAPKPLSKEDQAKQSQGAGGDIMASILSGQSPSGPTPGQAPTIQQQAGGGTGVGGGILGQILSGTNDQRQANSYLQQFASQSNEGYNPLAMQLLFTQAIGPLLGQIQGNQQAQMDQLYGGVGGLMGRVQMPGNMRGILAGNMGSQRAAASTLNNALAGAAIAGPALDQLMANINRDYEENFRAAVAAQQQASGGTTAGDQALIAALLGGGGKTE